MALTKREIEIYRNNGIICKDNKLVTPLSGILVTPLLKNNNEKTNGKKAERKNDPCKDQVYTFGILPTNNIFKSDYGYIPGTCPCTCEKGYCTRGCYNIPAVKAGNIIKTLLCYKCLNWVVSAIIAQLEYITEQAEKGGYKIFVRIHDTGDFYGDDYVNAWRYIAERFPNVKFWTYTKTKHENDFDDMDNVNIVKSNIPGIGYNFGHIDHVLKAYVELVKRGEKPYICRCGVDEKQHCYNCNNCMNNKYVLFIEHSTEYNAENDPLYMLLVAVIAFQNGNNHADVARFIESKIG